MDQAQLSTLLDDARTQANAGRFDSARAICERVFAHDPGMVGALQTYMAVTRVAPDDPVLARLRGFAGASGLAPALHSQVQFMLGKGLDDIGDHAGAFAAFKAANRLKHRPFNGAGQERLVAALIDAVGAMPDIALPPAAPRMVFVLGMPRSGTSLVAQMLGAHDRLENRGELTALGRAATAQARDLAAMARGLTPQMAQAIRDAYLAEAGQGAQAPVLVDKMPENYWLAWLIPALMPDAVIVHMHRDPRATCWSCFRNDFGQGHGYSTDFPTLAAHHARHARMITAWRRRAPAQWHDIALDGLVADPQAQLAPVLSALGLSWQATMASPERAGGALSTLSRWQARQGLDTRISGGWRAYLPMMAREWPEAVARLTP